MKWTIILLGLILWTIAFSILLSDLLVWAVQDFKRNFFKWRDEGSPLKIQSAVIQPLKAVGLMLTAFSGLTTVNFLANFTVEITYGVFGISDTPPDINYLWNMWH
jgi:hypothetical protein